MATTKVTITLADEQISAIRELVRSGKAESVSGFVQHAVTVSLADVGGWGVSLRQALEETGGPLNAEERAWADTILRPRSKARRAGKAA
jgi:Arc/MetJ-type ribon-helix-helix transcriptional regulator